MYVLAVAPTGFGKTVCFAYMAVSAYSKGQRVLILTHRIRLIRQAYKKIMSCGVTCGVINRKFTPNFDARIQIASIQTLAKRLDKYNLNFDLIIQDECHHSRAKQWADVTKACIDVNPKVRISGWTATPTRLDGAGLGEKAGGFYQVMVMGPSTKEQQDDGFLVKALHYYPKNNLDFSEVKIVAGDYNTKEAAAVISKSGITGDAIDYYRTICPGWPAIAFCINISEAEKTAREFCAAGWKFVVVTGEMDEAEQERYFAMLETREIHGVCAVDLISEGVDIPLVKCMIGLRPTWSLSLILQQWGRVLRPVYKEGMPLDTKAQRLAAIEASEFPYAVILDHVGNCMDHGSPDWEREWSLDGNKRSKKGKGSEKAIRITQCPECYIVMKPTLKCPECGYEFQIKVRELATMEGELSLMTPEDEAKIKRLKAKEISQAQTLEQLESIEKSRGYKPGWAQHVHLSRNKKLVG